MKKVCLIIPVYNEEENLPILKKEIQKVINNIHRYEFGILLINDGSKDNSLEIMQQIHIEDNRFSYLNLSRNFGKENALMAGIDYADGDANIIMDADLQDPPELIPELLKYWEEGYDDVYAKRKSREGESFIKKWTSKMYYRVLKKLTAIPIQEDTGDFRLLDRRCIETIRNLRENGRCSKSIFCWIGYKKKEVLFDRKPRRAGKTKWNYKNLIHLSIDGITALSIEPLRIATYFGILVFISFIIYAIYAIIHGINEIRLLNSFLLLATSVQAIFIGIMGEYVGRIFQESKNRPIYLVDSYNEEKEEKILKIS